MEWVDTIVKIVFLVLGTLVTVYVVPWLKEKGLYDIVKKMVQGAEKWSETMDIDKKEWVIERLEARGIEVTDYVEALIESACEELDIAWANVSSEFTEE